MSQFGRQDSRMNCLRGWLSPVLTFVLGVIAISSCPTPAFASTTYQTIGGWEIVESEDNCSAAMEFEGPGSTQLALVKRADGGVAVVIWNYNWSAREHQDYPISLNLNGKSFTGTGIGVGNGLHKGFAIRIHPDVASSFVNDFAAGSSLRVYLGDQKIDQLSLSGTAAAVGATDQCLRKVRQSIAAAKREEERWAYLPMDPFAKPSSDADANAGPRPHAAVSAAPKGNPGSWANANDYPSGALRKQSEGITRYTVTVGTDGRVINCTVTGSSGSPELDATTCSLVQRRGRFDPATDVTGEPIVDSWSSSVTWELPR